MLLLRNYIAVVLALLLAAADVSSQATDIQAADTNGDRAVNVLDMQRVVAAVLEDAGNRGDDVNGDGRVDVLDFQCILEAAREGDTGPAPSAPDPLQGNMPPRLLHLKGLTMAHVPVPVPLADDSDARWRCTGTCEYAVKSGPREGRYLLGLTPHAPPTFV